MDDLRGALGELSEEAFLHECALVHGSEGFFVTPLFVVVDDQKECVDVAHGHTLCGSIHLCT